MRLQPTKLAILALLVLALILSAPTSALAINNPTSATVGTVTLYDDILEAGDLGILLDYSIEYGSLPTETVTEAYRVSFNDVDGVTRLQSIVPYTLLDNGYGTGIAWIYFTAAQVTAYGIVEANMALHRVELYGNAALGWVPGPAPAVFDTLNTWHSTGDPNVLLSLDVLTYASALEIEWSLPEMVRATSVGTRLGTDGETYVENVIANARLAAPSAFFTDTISPVDSGIDYTVSFGATLSNGPFPVGGVVTGSPITLSTGANTVIVTTTGTFTLELNSGTVGTIESVVGGSTVTGSPVDLVAGTNTVTITIGGTGEALVTVALVSTQTNINDGITDTGLDLTDVATAFGTTRSLVSGLVWMALGIVFVAKARERLGDAGEKVTLLLFDLWIIAGTILGLFPLLAAALLFIGLGILTSYVLFFRGASA